MFSKRIIIITVSVQPFVSEIGKIDIPKGVKDIGKYINEHFDDIEFSEDFHEYDGSPMMVRNSNGDIIYSEE